MGLLDSFNPNFASSPQFQQGLLAMALASGNPRQAAGVQGLLQMQQQQEENKLNQQYRQAQIEKMAADQQKAANLQKMAAGLLGGSGFMQGQPSQGGAGSNGGMLGSGGSGGAVQSLTPDQVLGLKMMGIDATDVWKETRPDMQVANGYAYDRRNLGAGFMPSLQTTTDGKSVMTRIGPDGLPVISAPAGALDTFNAYQRAASSNKPMEVFNPSTGRREYVTESQVTDKAKGLSPTAAANGVPDGNYAAGPSQTSDATQKATEQLNSNWVTNNYNPTVAAAGAAGDILTNVRVSRDAMKNMGGTGWGTDVKAQAANMLTSIGIGGENAKLYATNAQTFNQAAMSRLQTVLNAAKGPQTEGDAARASKTYAQLGNTTEANAFILNLMEAQAQRDIMKAEFYQQAMPLARSRGDLTEVDREWQKRQPSVYSMPSMAQYNK